MELARVFKAMGDPVRLRLLSLIASHGGGEACVCDLTDVVDLSGPTISHHLKVLREAGLITGERRGTALHADHAAGAVRVRSAGSTPADSINPAVRQVMDERRLPRLSAKRYLDRELTDPAGKDVDAVRPIRDDIDRRVRALLAELVTTMTTEPSTPSEEESEGSAR
jgi:ArsR family transcriptional regulator